MTWTDLAIKAKDLPLGHVGKREAADAIQKEYAACREIEQDFSKKWRKKDRVWVFVSWQEAANFSAFLCDAVGSRRIKAVMPMPADDRLRGVAGGYYNGSNRTIFLPREQVCITTLVHETAHHVCYSERMHKGGTHGEDFCTVEKMLFDHLLLNPWESR